MNRLTDYLLHIAEAIRRIEAYTAPMGEDFFLNSQITQDAVVRNIEIIGEAGHNIIRVYPEFASENPHLRLEAAYKMRNTLSHGYFAVDFEIVWATIKTDLPKMLKDVEVALSAR